MNFLAFLVLGLVAGALAKLILPGRQGGGWIATLVLGVIGALVGGYLGTLLFHIGLGGLFDLRSWVLAVAGSLVVLILWGLLTGRRRRED